MNNDKIAGQLTLMYLIGILVIGIAVPQQPNTPSYEALNAFLNSYMLGEVLPEPSADFYFTAKVLICISWFITPLFVIARFILTLCRFPAEEIISYTNTTLSLSHNGKPLSLAASRLIMIFVAIASCASGYFAISVIYSTVPNEALTVTRGIHELFYGHFYRYLILYIILTVPIGGSLEILLFVFYCLLHRKRR